MAAARSERLHVIGGQPADPRALWDSPPCEPTLRDGKLFARRTVDSKGELAVRPAAIRSLREQSGELPLTIWWIIEGEQEVLSAHSTRSCGSTLTR